VENVQGRTSRRLPNYFSAVAELADATAELIENLGLCYCWNRDVIDDILVAVQTRHPNFARDFCLMLAAEDEIRRQLDDQRRKEPKP